ncbi:MAG: Crp/Fnr family transcriptional regulator [Fibrobacteres bacterium]|jgi:CRP/FNR family cyclic AMP-dependent transcriptional regulator|nr:Crp/Fnr family transcriptional regulator [Fibrobacterota bacterium]
MALKNELLRGVDLFSALDDAQVDTLASMIIEKGFKKGEIILMEDDDTSQSLFIIAKGEVKVVLTAEDGREAILASLKEGDFFGEMSLLDGEPRSATVRAVEDSRLLTIRREDFLSALRKQPDLALTLLGEMSKRLRRSNRQISSLALMRVYGRVAATLLQLMEERGMRTKSKDGQSIIVVKDRPTQQFIADMSGTTRETVSRVLNYFQKKGYIVLDGKDLLILQEEELKT